MNGWGKMGHPINWEITDSFRSSELHKSFQSANPLYALCRKLTEFRVECIFKGTRIQRRAASFAVVTNLTFGMFGHREPTGKQRALERPPKDPHRDREIISRYSDVRGTQTVANICIPVAINGVIGRGDRTRATSRFKVRGTCPTFVEARIPYKRGDAARTEERGKMAHRRWHTG